MKTPSLIRAFTGLCLLASALLFSACGTLAPGAYQKDEALYRADVVITTSYDVLHAFVTFEYTNRALLVDRPEIKKAADRVRVNAPLWIGSAIALREAYSAVPTPENRDKLQASIAILRSALIEATAYLAANQTQLPSS